MANFAKPYTLAIDIGGSGLKMMVLDKNIKTVTERTRVLTPDPATPTKIVDCLAKMLKEHGKFDRVSVGFPGVVINGVVETAPNLDSSWEGFDLQTKLSKLANKPTRVINDADVQGYGDIKGKGVELVLTLGTGMGSSIFIDGKLVPNLELAHHPFKGKHTYEHVLGKKALEKHGKKKWNHHLKDAIELTARIFNYETLYLGGGNNKKIEIDLPKNVETAKNIAGLLGGVKLWDHEK